MSDDTTTQIPPHVLEYIRRHEVLTLATSSPAGVPRAATFTYATDGSDLVLWMRPDTMTAHHIEQNPVVSFTIDDYAADWGRIAGVQGAGEARVLLNAADVGRARELLSSKFSALGEGALRDVSFVRVAASDIVFIDQSRRDQTRPYDFRGELAYSVFRDLPEREVVTIGAKLRTVEVGPGEVIVRQGAPADKFFIIVDGEAEVIREDDGDQRTLARLGAGDFFGEIAILRDSPRVATVRATVPSRLLEMERDAFRGLVAQSLGTSEHFDAVIRERMAPLS